MSRYCGDKDSTEVIKAVDVWKEKCLLSDGSVFSDESVWASATFSELHYLFTENPDEGTDSFLDKLEKQLSSAKSETKKLAAEMLWFMQLFVSDAAMKGDTKRQQLARVWSWSGADLDLTNPLLNAPLESGIGNPGTAYNTRKWAEFRYFIDVGIAFKSMLKDEQGELLSEPWAFSAWLDEIEQQGKPQLRHIMKFLVFPDYFERIATAKHKLAIVNAFHNKDIHPGEIEFTELDKEVYEIRQELEAEHGTQSFDFYNTPGIRDVWDVQRQPPRRTDGVPQGTISRGNVLAARDEIDARSIRSDERSVTYDLFISGKRYPPKLVYALAHKHAGGEELDRSTFEGGEGTKCFSVLRDLGFYIERKDFVAELLKSFIAQAEEGEDLTTRQYPSSFQGLKIKVSFGQGVFSHVPWISFTGYDQTTSNGIYPVYLFYKSVGALILTYGVSETNKPSKEWADADSKEKVKGYLQREFQHQAERYGESYVHSVYRLPIDYSEKSITDNLDQLIHEYHSLLGELQPMEPELVPPPVQPVYEPQAITESFATALRESNIQFGARHDQVVKAFVSSLMAKPLAILTGLSGSGKTQIAIRFGEWLGSDRMLVMPVRPDWTGAEALFGYEDALKPANAGRAAWAVPDTLRFLLNAHANPNYPYLLILDEMNLAHVERYFADVLSGMESEQPCLPNLVLEADGHWRIPPQQDEKLPLPKNVFIVGTVNVDETTYMFSPKVLDRANTFEFRVTADDLGDDYQKPTPCTAGNLGLVRGFLEISSDSDWHRNNGDLDKASLAAQLRFVHSLLAEHGFEFGHRVFYESQRFAAIYSESDEGEISAILDLVLMQKVLPRLHGSRRRLEELLRGLASFCFSAEADEISTTQAVIFEPDEQDARDAQLPLAFNKLLRMLKSLRANQFTSFTE